LAWRRAIIESGGDPREASDDPSFGEEVARRAGDPFEVEAFDDELGEVVTREAYDEGRLRDARAFAGVVTGKRIPVGAELDRYFAGSGHTKRYQSRTRLAARRLEAWLSDRPEGNHVGAVTRREAGHFVDYLSETCKTSVTAGSLLSSLSSYWAWMKQKGEADDNPWKDQPRPLVKGAVKSAKRPFTDNEVVKLLSGTTYGTLHELMRIAALSGLRIGEIGRLTVADCDGGVFDIRDTKTKAGERRVPIHTHLRPIVAARSAGKPAEAFLFDELKASPGRERERTAKASERFTEYRRAIGIDERGETQRQANADFHSFRRWFITKAEQAGQQPHIISAVAGHAEGRQGMTLGRYSKGPSDDQLRDVVESVQLPEGVPLESPGGHRMGEGKRGPVAN
jgi:integrase